jgi:phytoene dehydrogenase-like protein
MLESRTLKTSTSSSVSSDEIASDYDVVVIGAGIGGLSAAAILSSVYNLKVGVFEAHYRLGGCAHSFPHRSKSGYNYLFDAGPTILLGCSSKPYNPLRQVMDFVGARCEWIPWDEWGMVTEQGQWDFKLGENHFEQGALLKYGGTTAVEEFRQLRTACIPLTAGAASIPTKALRGDSFKILSLLPYFDALQKVIPYADVLDGSFEPFMQRYVRNPFLRAWLDALAFSISGLPAAQTGAAAMAYTIYDLHRDGATMDYPRGGVGAIAEELCDVIRSSGSHVHLSTRVSKICVEEGPPSRAVGIQLDGVSKRNVLAKRGVISNADIWSLSSLLSEDSHRLSKDQKEVLLRDSSAKKRTKSFLHLHLGLDIRGLEARMKKGGGGDGTRQWKAHYTVMDRGLIVADPCMDRNMVAVSFPSLLDSSLVTKDGGDPMVNQLDKAVIHAYGAGNEDYNEWVGLRRRRRRGEGRIGYEDGGSDDDYERMKAEGAEYLYRSVGRALDLSVEEIKARSDVALIGSPLTHERYNRRDRGTYGAAWGSMIASPETPLKSLYLAGDSIFPGIGVPAVALSGAIAANTMIRPIRHISKLLS